MNNKPPPQTPKPPLRPVPSPSQMPDGIGFGNAGSLHYNKESCNLYWNESPYVMSNESTTLLGKITDVKKIAKQLSAIISKRLLKGEI